jgi:dTDP-4-dehydrorhamnose reductase
MKTKILIIGANGQVGSELRALSNDFPQFDYFFATRNEVNIYDLESIEMLFHDFLPNYCINCAAYTAVDKAETDEENAHLTNVTAVANLAINCQLQNVTLIHLSTDYVYHNGQNTPFVETDTTNPQGVYAATKLEGELTATDFYEQTMIIRTSWVYSAYGHNFVKTMLRLGQERENLNVVFDQIGTPTYARDLAKAMLNIIEKVEKKEVEKEKMFGTFHYSNEGVASWYDFAKVIFEQKNISCQVQPIVSADFPTPAQRPPFSVLDKSKIKTTFGIKIPHWQESLKEMLAFV